MPPSLAATQGLLYRLITAPGGVEEGLVDEKCLSSESINTLIGGGGRLSATERVEIYANMYFYRLLEAIREDFSATARVLGDAKFHNLITGYLVEHPPSHPSITEASRYLADFARNSPMLEEWPFLADLIRLERALVDVFLSPDADPLTFDQLRAIPPHRWPSLRIAVHPAVQVLDCEWRVEEILRAIEGGRSPLPALRESVPILVSRKDCLVTYRTLDRSERSALDVIRRGGLFDAICEAISTQISESEMSVLLNRMLSRWLADGVLVSE
jgi:hypothetical protein